MTPTQSAFTSIAAVAALASAPSAQTAEPASVDALVAAIKSSDDKVRGPAWQGAASYGAPAVKPVAALLTDSDFEVARSAQRALYKIVRYAGRPGAAKEARAVTSELVPLLKSDAVVVRRNVLWMLSEIAGDEAVPAMAEWLSDKDLREDARCALMRIPGRKATAAFKTAFASAPEDFKYALAETLRQRGVKVEGYPSRKLVPTRQTTVGQPKTT